MNKIIVKRCYYCSTEIERQKFFTIPSLSDQVLQFKFGNCMIVLSRKYAVVLLLIFIGLFCYFELFVQTKFEVTDPGISINYSKSNINTFQLLGLTFFNYVANTKLSIMDCEPRFTSKNNFKEKLLIGQGM